MTILIYSVTVFLSAFLLFVMQPMFAKMILPFLGGSSSVWNTCLVFFQMTLLAGYSYAHAMPKWVGVRRQPLIQFVLLALPILILPFGIPSEWTPPTQSNPIPSLLSLLGMTIGLPFFCVSTMAPLMQKWFASSGHKSAGDPYFLYASSNGGSLLALLSYPLLVEPNLTLELQSRSWAVGYGILFFLTLGCSLFIWKVQVPAMTTATPEGAASLSMSEYKDRLSKRQTMKWVLFAFIPSSLLLGVTNYISTDLASMPLLWVIPLILYLLTFVLTFSRRVILPHSWMIRLFPCLVLLLSVVMVTYATLPIGILILLNLAAFFVTAMSYHGTLAQDRPSVAHLTAFYLWLSVGGVLGGIFNALIAPVIFDNTVEYPLVIILACLFLPQGLNQGRMHWKDPVLALVVAGLTTAGLFITLEVREMDASLFRHVCVFGLPAAIGFMARKRPWRFGLSLGAMLLIGLYAPIGPTQVIATERSFFGVHYVEKDETGKVHRLLHGTTVHGLQIQDPSYRHEPLSYFGRNGPIGHVMEIMKRRRPNAEVAVVGLGAGTLASYAAPRETWTFYEIDPAVHRIASDPRYFSFLDHCTGRCNVILGDGRFSLAKEPDRHFDMIILDAFSSDAIPVHLVTREALEVYLAKLRWGGILVFNITNRFFDLAELFGNLAQDAGLFSMMRADDVSNEASRQGYYSSNWVVMAREEHHLGTLVTDSRWQRLKGTPDGKPLWTDQYSNIATLLNFG